MRWAHAVLAGLQILTGGTALADLIGVRTFALVVLAVGAVQASLATYQAGADSATAVPQKNNPEIVGPAAPTGTRDAL